MKKIILPVFVTITLLFMLLGCKKQNTSTPAPATPGSNEVWIQNMAFTPTSITIAVNTTIKWKKKNGFPITLQSNTVLFNSGNINLTGTYSHKFTTVGKYPYNFKIHPSMTGTIFFKKK